MIIELILGSYDAHSVQINKQLFISSTAHTHAKAGINSRAKISEYQKLVRLPQGR
jgi:hypothetical protein